jgi:hypothetical protein
MAISPKVKIITGVLAIGGGSFELYNAFKSEGKKRIVHGIIGAVLVFGGIFYARKSYVALKNASTNSDTAKSKTSRSQEKANNSIDELSSGTASTIVTIPTQNNTPTPDPSQTVSPNTNTGTVSTKQNSRAVTRGRSEGKSSADGREAQNKPRPLTPMEINRRNQKKKDVQTRIAELNRQIGGLPNDSDGRATKLAINNELALLTAQLRLI